MSNDVAGLVERLEGIYRVPITDGLGAVGGGEEPDNPTEFVRRFPAVPIQQEAASTIRALVAQLRDADAVIQRLNSGAELQAIMAAHNDTLEKLREAVEVMHRVSLKSQDNSTTKEAVGREAFLFLATMEKTHD